MLDDLEAYAAGYAASLTVTTQVGAPIESASVTLRIFALADTASATGWAGKMITALIEQGPGHAGFISEETPAGMAYQQLARPAVPADPEGTVTFSSLIELRDAVIAAGLPCTAWEEDTVVPMAAESGSCSDSSLLMTFSSAEQQIAAIDNLRAVSLRRVQTGEQPVPMLVGPNWVVLAPEAWELAASLGGGVYAQ